MSDAADGPASSPCETCGACCAYSAEWPRFWTETDEEIATIPPNLVSEDGCGMACDGDRCLALQGIVGEVARCAIYPLRPSVCRECMPGDHACTMAREHYGLAPLEL
ncbi:MAG: YkgJ family cysteine cluster protein [Hyphomicrobiaceae bacterium]